MPKQRNKQNLYRNKTLAHTNQCINKSRKHVTANSHAVIQMDNIPIICYICRTFDKGNPEKYRRFGSRQADRQTDRMREREGGEDEGGAIISQKKRAQGNHTISHLMHFNGLLVCYKGLVRLIIDISNE